MRPCYNFPALFDMYTTIIMYDDRKRIIEYLTWMLSPKGGVQNSLRNLCHVDGSCVAVSLLNWAMRKFLMGKKGKKVQFFDLFVQKRLRSATWELCYFVDFRTSSRKFVFIVIKKRKLCSSCLYVRVDESKWQNTIFVFPNGSKTQKKLATLWPNDVHFHCWVFAFLASSLLFLSTYIGGGKLPPDMCVLMSEERRQQRFFFHLFRWRGRENFCQSFIIYTRAVTSQRQQQRQQINLSHSTALLSFISIEEFSIDSIINRVRELT